MRPQTRAASLRLVSNDQAGGAPGEAAPTPWQRNILREAWRLIDSRFHPDDPLVARRLSKWDSREDRDYRVELFSDLTLVVRDPRSGEVVARSSLHRRRVPRREQGPKR